jgi:hypothetical protein
MAKSKIDMNKFTEDVEKLPLPWFGVTHGIDNYEDIVLLTEVAAITAGFQYLSGNEMQDEEDQKDYPLWNIKTNIILRSGRRITIDLNPVGYNKLVKDLRKLQSDNKS